MNKIKNVLVVCLSILVVSLSGFCYMQIRLNNELKQELKTKDKKMELMENALSWKNPKGLYNYNLIDGFISPVENVYLGRVTSEFMSYDRPFHDGVDIGSPVKHLINPKYGIVKDIYFNTYFGNCVVIEHQNYISVFKHLDKVLVKKHQPIEQGKVFAIMGDTGRWTTGVHVHWTLMKFEDGHYVKINPFTNTTDIVKGEKYYIARL